MKCNLSKEILEKYAKLQSQTATQENFHQLFVLLSAMMTQLIYEFGAADTKDEFLEILKEEFEEILITSSKMWEKRKRPVD